MKTGQCMWKRMKLKNDILCRFEASKNDDIYYPEQILSSEHIDASTKRPPFYRRLFWMYWIDRMIVFWFLCQLTKFTNFTMHLLYITQCTIQNRNVLILVLNSALLDMEELHCGIFSDWSVVNESIEFIQEAAFWCTLAQQYFTIIVPSKWARWRLKSPASRLFTHPFIQAQMKENIKAPRNWPLWGKFTGDRWISRTKGQLRGKCSHSMTSSCYTFLFIVYLIDHSKKTCYVMGVRHQRKTWHACVWKCGMSFRPTE